MKVSKASVDYGPGHPMGDHCAVCRNYQGDPTGSGPCTKVEGTVGHMNWCRLFARKRIESAARKRRVGR